MQISEDETGRLTIECGELCIGPRWDNFILSDEDEAALLERLIDRAGGLQNLWTEAVIQEEDRCRSVLLTRQTDATQTR